MAILRDFESAKILLIFGNPNQKNDSRILMELHLCSGENDIFTQSILAYRSIITVRNILAKYIPDFILSIKEFNYLVFTILNNY